MGVGNEARPMAAGPLTKIKHVHADWPLKALLLDKSECTLYPKLSRNKLTGNTYLGTE